MVSFSIEVWEMPKKHGSWLDSKTVDDLAPAVPLVFMIAIFGIVIACAVLSHPGDLAKFVVFLSSR